jgi:hypothetical protein
MTIDFDAQDAFDLDSAFVFLARRVSNSHKILPGSYEFRQYVEAHGGIINEVTTRILGVHGTVTEVNLSLASDGDTELELEIAAGIGNDLSSLGLGTSVSLPIFPNTPTIVHVYFQ